MKIPKHYFSNSLGGLESVVLNKPHTVQRYQKGELLFTSYSREYVYYYIRKGQCVVYGLTERGDQKVLCYYADGVFSHVAVQEEFYSIFDHELIEAVTDVEVCLFRQQDILELLRENFDLVLSMLRFTNELLVLLSYHSLMLAYLPSDKKLYDYLYMCHSHYPKIERDGRKVIAINQSEIASYIGVTRTQVTRLLKQLKAERLIETCRGQIIILDPERLLSRCTRVINCGGVA